MEAFDKIRGKKLFTQLNQLREKKTILKMNILGTGYEGLTIVTGVKNNNGAPFFLIDYPGGAGDILKNSIGKKAVFEFTDDSKIQYSFRTFIGKVGKFDIWIGFPEFIDRIQRRKHFRVSPPAGTVIVFNYNGKYELNVINISEGGALISQKARFHNKYLFNQGGNLQYLNMICNDDELKVNIRIRRAEIKRIEKRTESGRFNYAVKFIDVGKKEEEDIKDFIYRSQRQALKKRSFSCF